MEPTLHEAFGLGFQAGDAWKQVFTQKKSNKRREEVFEFVRPNMVIETPEGAPYVQLEVVKAYTTAAVHTKFTGSMRITDEMWNDNFYDSEMEEKSWGLGDAVQRKLTDDATGIFYNGATSITAPNGLPLFNTLQTLKKAPGVTDSNYSTAALASDSLNDGISDMMETLDENGMPAPFGTETVQLIHPPRLNRLAKQFKVAPYEPDTANFTPNVFSIEPVCLPFLIRASATIRNTQWYLRDARRAKNYYFLREGPTFSMVEDPYTDDVIVKVKIRYSFLMGSWRGLWGSSGV
jgi:hypothetical protein